MTNCMYNVKNKMCMERLKPQNEEENADFREEKEAV